MNINEIVLDTLTKSDTPLKSGEIAEKAGVDKKEVDKALKNLKKEESIVSPKRCYYAAK
jgi:predicted transcriptional regulator